ncbi:MAG: PAS domain S-box protein [Rubrivivax sp.]
MPSRATLAALLDGAGEPLLLFDDLGQLAFCNQAAMRQLRVEPGQGAAQLLEALGADATNWLQACLRARATSRFDARCVGTDGGTLTLAAWRVARDLAVRVVVGPAKPPEAVEAASFPAVSAGPNLEMLRMLWGSPFPATLQNPAFRLVAVNEAYLGFTGLKREALIGSDPIDLQPLEDQEMQLAARSELPGLLAGRAMPVLREQRLIDASGRERWCRVSAFQVATEAGRPLLLSVLQESTAEHVARAQADRSLDELAQWFDLSPTGMLVFDESGLILRSNPAFEALVGQVPVMLADAPTELQTLLDWPRDASPAGHNLAAPPVETQVSLPLPDGRRQRLSARIRSFATEQGQHRFMAVVEDRSAEEDRDLAQLEIGALMDTAGVGVATFDSARGWLRPRAERRRLANAKATGLQSIGRDVVEPDSMPEYEKLQQALRHGERAEVRYAVRHPELGLRWLLTRVDPGVGDSSRRTVVTLDVTEQESAQRHSQQLLRELTTILDGTSAGIAYLRGTMLVRCNRRFETMLGLAAGAAAGATTAELFARMPQALAALATLQPGQSIDSEIEIGAPPGNGNGNGNGDGDGADGGAEPLWYSLSVRGAGSAPGEPETVAVLTDISRLKWQHSELQSLLRERELMFSLSDVGIVRLRGGRIERANQAMAALTGFAEAELPALDPAELDADAPTHLRHAEEESQALRLQGRYQGERQLRRRDGSLLWVQVAQRLVDPDDERAGRICSYVDVDERHRAREALSRQAERTRAILDSVLVGIVTVGDGGIEWMNRSARRMFAGDLADFVGEPISTVATPEADHPLRRTDYLHTLAEGQAQTFECRLQARDGREFWVVGNAVVTGRESTGRQITFALLDIERRRQAEVSIKQTQASLQRIIETAPLAIALFDAETNRVLRLNQMAAAYFGRPLQQLMGRSPDDWAPSDVAEALKADLMLASASTDVLRRESRIEGPGGARWWDSRVVSLPATAGAAAQVLLVASDVSEQRAEAQERFEAAIAQREMLVKEVHHRIKNNLQGVAGLLQQNAVRHPQMASLLGESVAQVQAIAQVYGLQVGNGGPLAVVDVLQAVAQSVQRTFGRDVRVEVQDDAALEFLLPENESIPIALTLNELLTNAIKHSPQGEVVCQIDTIGPADAQADTQADNGARSEESADTVRVRIANAGTLPADFDLAAFRGGVSGLGLVRALLPRRSATLTLVQRGDQVHAQVRLSPPSVQRSVPSQ